MGRRTRWCKEIAIVKENIRYSSKSVDHKELENNEIWSKNRDFFLIGKNVLFLKNKDNVDFTVVPKNLRKKVVPLYHDSLTVGHLGFDKTFAAINNQFY